MAEQRRRNMRDWELTLWNTYYDVREHLRQVAGYEPSYWDKPTTLTVEDRDYTTTNSIAFDIHEAVEGREIAGSVQDVLDRGLANGTIREFERERSVTMDVADEHQIGMEP